MSVEGYETDSVSQIETNLDDMTPEQIGHACVLLLEAGALDVWTSAIQMKKQRPATLLSVLCAPGEVPRFADLILAHTSAFGVRVRQNQRIKLRRDFVQVQTPFGPVTVKRGFRDQTLLKCVPEYECCRALAQEHSVPIQQIFNAAQAAVLNAVPDTLHMQTKSM